MFTFLIAKKNEIMADGLFEMEKVWYGPVFLRLSLLPCKDDTAEHNLHQLRMIFAFTAIEAYWFIINAKTSECT